MGRGSGPSVFVLHLRHHPHSPRGMGRRSGVGGVSYPALPQYSWVEIFVTQPKDKNWKKYKRRIE